MVATTVGYSMLYSAVGFGNPQTTSIGLATSADGVTWERRPEPVIEMGMCGDEPYAAAPRLIAFDDGFLVLYDAGRQTAAARSVNLTDWTCVTDGPVLTAADVPDSTGIHTIAATLADDRVSVLVESLIGSSGGSELWLAEERGLR